MNLIKNNMEKENQVSMMENEKMKPIG